MLLQSVQQTELFSPFDLMYGFMQNRDVLPFPISMKELAKLGATTREQLTRFSKGWEEGRISYEYKHWFLLIENILWNISKKVVYWADFLFSKTKIL